VRPDDLPFLLGPWGQELLAEAAAVRADNHLALAERLGRLVGPERAHAVVETALLRQRAQAKFSRANQMYFVRPALEQASAEIVARYRARRYAAAKLELVADLGCGIGGDALALSASATVIGVERDELRLAMARQNVAAYGHGERFWPLLADLRALAPLPVNGVFADPARRDERGRRLFSVREYGPPLTTLEPWLDKVKNVGVKVSPAIEYAEIPPTAEVEFISVAGEVREGVLWYGALNSGVSRRATLLPGEWTLTDDGRLEPVELAEPGAFLVEPDGAIIRAHLVEPLARLLGAAKIDEHIAYLTADERLNSPMATYYAVDDVLPFQLKRLRQYLRQRGIGQITIKKRGSPLDTDELQRQLRLKGSERRILFLTQARGQPVVIVGRPAEPVDSEPTRR
jgi:hypothetical protein